MRLDHEQHFRPQIVQLKIHSPGYLQQASFRKKGTVILQKPACPSVMDQDTFVCITLMPIDNSYSTLQRQIPYQFFLVENIF